jgi:cytidine deaminase
MELDRETEDRLVAAADEVRANAYAPYSGFGVGAALLAADGRLFAGCNVENASYGLSVCAERHAVAAAVAAGVRHFRALAVVTPASPPAPPCGACRQVLVEFGDLAVILASPDGRREHTTVFELAPRAFRALDLDRG